MSLDKVAQHLAAQGRGPDSVLVHMSPKEVGALQHMAKQHGGSLSINPQTGLPEAGFLDAILPVVAGAGLSMVPGVGPLMAAGIVGGGTALLTKDLNKGLMAGLGAFGGASLAGGIMTAGSGAGLASAETLGAGATEAAQNSLMSQAQSNIDPSLLEGMSSQQVASANVLPTTPNSPTGTGSAFDQMQKGFQATKFDSNYLKNNMLPIGAALAPALMGGDLFGGNPAQQHQTASAGYVRPYTYSQTRNPGYTGAGTPYFNQSMTAGAPIASGDYGAQLMPMAAEGGIMGTRYMAEGGIADVAPKKTPTLADYTAAANSANTAAKSVTPPVMQALYVDPQQRYTAPVNQVPQAVTDYNSMLAQRAQQEYVQQPQLNAMIPQQFRPAPVEYKAPNLMPVPLDGMQKTEVQKLQEQIDAMNAQQQQSMYFGGNGGDGGGDGFAMGGGITNSRQAAVQSYAAAAQKNPTAMKELMAKARGGDYDAMIALNNLQATPNQNYAAGGGIYDLGGYSDGGRLLKGPGDGVSDDIPATIGQKQPARLADGEFVIPARIVSELGNGSTDAGAKRLYQMMERVQSGRKKSVGKDKVAVDSKPYKHLPA